MLYCALGKWNETELLMNDVVIPDMHVTARDGSCFSSVAGQSCSGDIRE